MIFNPVRQLLSAGITDILVVTGKDHMGEIVRLLGSGSDFSCNFTFRVQEKAGELPMPSRLQTYLQMATESL